MRKPLALSHGIRLGGSPSHSHAVDARRAQAQWQAHVEAGRIGSGAGTTPEQRARHAWNERALLGRVVTPELAQS